MFCVSVLIESEMTELYFLTLLILLYIIIFRITSFGMVSIIVWVICSFGSLKLASFSFSHFFASYSCSSHFQVLAPVASFISQEPVPQLLSLADFAYSTLFLLFEVGLVFQLDMVALAPLFDTVLHIFTQVLQLACCSWCSD